MRSPILFPLDDNQTRTLTPKEALDKGSDFLVIGRPITTSDNPLQSL
jgi:orotidine-5'-phosphate decarboxylase